MDAKAVEKIVKKTREEKLREQKIQLEILKSLNDIKDPEQKFQSLLNRFVLMTLTFEKLSRQF